MFAASSLSCAPFRAILNSASVILALSFSCPVIAPRLGSLQDIEAQVGKEWITLYDGELNLPTMLKAVLWHASQDPQILFWTSVI